MELRHNQRVGARFALEKKRAALFMRPGQGKTRTALAIIEGILDENPHARVLVLAPKRVIEHSWTAEMKTDAPHLWDMAALVDGAPKERLAAYDAAMDSGPSITLSSHTVIDTIPLTYLPDAVILDELSSYKNWNTKRTKAARRLTAASTYVVGLTGTPAADSYEGLWSQMRLIDKGESLGGYKSHYMQAYFTPSYTLPNGAPVGWKLKEGAEGKIHDRIRPRVYAPEEDLSIRPSIQINPRHGSVPVKVEKIIKRLARDGVMYVGTSEEDKETILYESPAARVSAARQMSGGAVIAGVSDGSKAGTTIVVHHEREDMLRRTLKDHGSRHALIVYNYRAELEAIRRVIPGVKDARDKGAIESWQASELQYMTLHPQSAGHGLNLQHGGDTIIWYTLPVSNELWEQTNARLARPGGSKQVSVEPILLTGTPDQALFDVLMKKGLTQAELLREVVTNYLGEDDV